MMWSLWVRQKAIPWCTSHLKTDLIWNKQKLAGSRAPWQKQFLMLWVCLCSIRMKRDDPEWRNFSLPACFLFNQYSMFFLHQSHLTDRLRCPLYSTTLYLFCSSLPSSSLPSHLPTPPTIPCTLTYPPILPPFSPSSPSTSSPEGRSFPDGALHTTAGAHHADQRQRVRWGRLLLPALHWCHTPPGGDAVCFRAPGDSHSGGEAASSGGWRGRAHLCVTTQQAGCYPALDPKWPGVTRYLIGERMGG